MAQTVFNRIEKKFLLNEEQYELMRRELAPFMDVDEYGEHTIRNVYYDTENDELVRTSIEKPEYKEKFRIRCYGQPGGNSNIFLEIKKKYDGVVNKRRIVMTQEEALYYLRDGIHPEAKKAKHAQIFREVDYVLSRYHLVPKMYLAYDRIALFGKEDAEFRITFDRNIRCRTTDLTLDRDTNTTMLLEDGYRIMEVKITNAMPLWFVDILSRNNIRTTSFSKYGNCYKRNLVEGVYDYADTTLERSFGLPEEQSATITVLPKEILMPTPAPIAI